MIFFLRYATKAAKPSECCAAGIPTTPDPPSVANGGFAPLGGAAAISMAALKAPVASPEAYISVKARQSGCAKIGLWVE